MAVGDAAWLVAVPCSLLTTVAVVALGPPLGRALFRPDQVEFVDGGAWPEPTEHARYLIAAAAPFVVACIVAAWGRSIADTPLRRTVARAGGPLLLAFTVFALVAQHTLAFRGAFSTIYPQHRIYFTPATLVVAVLLAGALVATLRRPTVVERLRGSLRETPWTKLLAGAAVATLLALWMLTALNSDATIGETTLALRQNVPFWLDETFAVLNGLAPLATFHAQYAQLWPYVTAGAMALLGGTYSVFAAVMVSATVATMLAVFATFRRVVGNSLLALALFAPFLATSFFKEQGTLANRYGPANLFSLFPIRYGGPYVLAWLVVRQLDGRRPRRIAMPLVVAGLVLVNNPEFGAPAFAATVVTLLLTLPQLTWGGAARVLGAALAGIAAALAVTTAATLAVAGMPPHFGLLFEFSRVYALDGFGMLPMPTFGFHLAVYVTFAAALILAAVRAVQRERDVPLTGILCWIGVFGLGAGAYYAGRSHPDVLIDLFSPWALALAMLLVVVVRLLLARPVSRRWPTAAELAVLLGFGLAVCSLGQTPTPWSQVARLSRTTPTPAFRQRAIEQFVRSHTVPGQRVALVVALGHRIAYDAGVRDVDPYASTDSMPTTAQWSTLFRTIQAQRLRTIFVATLFRETDVIQSQLQAVLVNRIADAGFHTAAVGPPPLHLTQLVR